MPVYTVHEPPLRAHEALPNPLRFVFVRDGFYFSAFVVAVLWMLWHRMWLVLLIYIVVALGLDYGMSYARHRRDRDHLVQLFLVLLIGIGARDATTVYVEAARLEKHPGRRLRREP